MKAWPLAVLIVALLPHQPDQAAQQVQHQARGGKGASNPPAAMPVVPPPQNPPTPIAPIKQLHTKDEPVRVAQPIAITTRPDYPALAFSFLLVGVGAFQAWLLFGTMQAIQKQAVQMKRQTGIREKNTAAAEANAEAAKANAEAANRSIEVMVSKERARVRVEVSALELDEPIEDFSIQQVKYKVFSYGAAAFISDSTAFVEISDSQEPPQSTVNPPASLPAVLYPTVEGIDKVAIIFTTLTQEYISRIHEGKAFVHFRGSIKYGDVFASGRETRFKYVWKSTGYSAIFDSYRGYWLKAGKPEDNSET